MSWSHDQTPSPERTQKRALDILPQLCKHYRLKPLINNPVARDSPHDCQADQSGEHIEEPSMLRRQLAAVTPAGVVYLGWPSCLRERQSGLRGVLFHVQTSLCANFSLSRG